MTKVPINSNDVINLLSSDKNSNDVILYNSLPNKALHVFIDHLVTSLCIYLSLRGILYLHVI